MKKDNVYIIANSNDIKTFANEEIIQLSKNYYMVFFTDKNEKKKKSQIINCFEKR